MARVSIYVPDDLKERMDAAGDAINWSSIVRPVFEATIADFEHRRGQTMESAIERLRASKSKYTAEEASAGKADGLDWARDNAEYADLKRISELKTERIAANAFGALYYAVDPNEELNNEERCRYLFGDDGREISNDYVAAFIEGAQEYFAEIEGKL